MSKKKLQSAANMDAKSIIEALGGDMEFLSKELRVGQTTIYNWIARGSIPARYSPTIERLSGRKIKCEQICPDVEWWVLREQPCNEVSSHG